MSRQRILFILLGVLILSAPLVVILLDNSNSVVEEQLRNGGIKFDETDFIAYDLDKDNVLTEKEFKSAIKNSTEHKNIVRYKIALAKKADQNNDGKLERKEFQKHTIELINKLLRGENVDGPSNGKPLIADAPKSR